jgi:hypothetical protein
VRVIREASMARTVAIGIQDFRDGFAFEGKKVLIG